MPVSNKQGNYFAGFFWLSYEGILIRKGQHVYSNYFCQIDVLEHAVFKLGVRLSVFYEVWSGQTEEVLCVIHCVDLHR